MTTAGTRPRLLRGRALVGANVHHGSTVFVQKTALGRLYDMRVDAFGQPFARRFLRRFDGLALRGAGGCVTPAVRQALLDGPAPLLTEVLLEAILAVERFLACSMHRLDLPDFAEIVEVGDPDGTIDFVWSSHSAELSRGAVRAAWVGVTELLAPEFLPRRSRRGTRFRERIKELRRLARRRRWSPHLSILAHGARSRGLEFETLTGNYLRIGAGSAQRLLADSSLDALTRAVPPLRSNGSRPQQGGGGAAGERQVRLLVTRSEVLAAVQMQPPIVVGDGERTLESLVSWLRRDPMRRGAAWHPIASGEDLRLACSSGEWNADDVLPPGVPVAVPGADSFELGAIPVDVSDRLPADVHKKAIELAAASQRAIASIEFWTDDIERPHPTAVARMRLVSRPPEFAMYATARGAHVDRLCRSIFDLVSSPQTDGTIPTVCLVGSRQKRSLLRDLERALRKRGVPLGIAVRGEAVILGRRIDRPATSPLENVSYVLRDPRVGTLVSATSPGELLRSGLRLEHCTTSVVLDPSPTDDDATLGAALDVVLRATTGHLVLSIDHPFVRPVLERASAARVILTAARADRAMAVEHVERGGSCIVITSADGEESVEWRSQRGVIARLPLSSVVRAGESVDQAVRRRARTVAAVIFAMDHPSPPAS